MPFLNIFCHRIVFTLSTLLMAVWFGAQVAKAAVLMGPGDIAFVGYNADGNDDLAFVLLKDIEAGQTIYFTDKNWDGTTFTSAEGEVTWTADVTYTIGTVITLNNLSTSVTASAGVVSTTGNVNLSGSNEALLAYIGTSANPTAFLAAIANDTFAAASSSLTNTGLIIGQTALELNVVDADADVAVYNGTRQTQTAADIHTAAQWLTQDGSGDQSADTISPDLPFDTTAFAAPTAVMLQSVATTTPHSTSLLWLTAACLFVTTIAIWYQQKAAHPSSIQRNAHPS